MELYYQTNLQGVSCYLYLLPAPYSRPPQVEILAPLNNPTVMTPEPVTLEVNATDPDDGIARVEFWLDYDLVGTVTNAPYRFVYDTSREWGLQRRFTARAVDHYGLTTVSTSEYFTILPQPEPPPANDNFADRTPLPAAFTNQLGSNYLASREPAEPGSGGASVWWSWTASQSGYHTILLQASPGYSLAAFRGNSLDSLELLGTSHQTMLVQNPFGPHQIEFWESELLLNAEAGTTYAFSVARGVDDPFGNPFLLALFPGARPAITVNINPAESPVMEGVPITLSAQPTDVDGAIREVQFTLYGVAQTNVVLTQPPYELTLTNLPANGYWFVAAATDDQGLISASASVGFSVQSPPPVPPPGDLFAGRIPITGPQVTRTGSLENSRSGSIWYAWTAPATRTFTVTLTSEVGRYPNLNIWQGTDETNLTKIAEYRYAGTDKELDYTARILLEATEGQVYILQLDAGSFGAGYTLDIQDSLPPTVRIMFPRLTDTIRGKDSFLITASASDPDGTIARVECFYDFKSIGVLTKPPYQWLVRIPENMASGHAIRVNVYDDHGLENLEVQNGVIVYPAPPSNDFFANATLLHGFTANLQGRLSGATIEAGEPGVTGGTDGIGASAWFAWRAPADGTVVLAMQCGEAAFDVYSTDTPDADLTRLQPILQGTYSTVSGLHQRAWRAVAGVDYRIAIRAKAFNFAQYDLRLLLVPDRAGNLAISLPHAGSTSEVALEASGLPGAPTVIETSVDLIHWEPIGEGNGTAFEFLHQSIPAASTSRFYRTVTWP